MTKYLLAMLMFLFLTNIAFAEEAKDNKKNHELTEIIFLLDRSGSMYGLEKETIGGFNSFVEKQAKIGPTIITTILFDDKYEILYSGQDAKTTALTDKEYYARGMTAMLDAIGKTIVDVNKRLEETKLENKPSKIIFVITTDGKENASKEYTYQKIKEMITLQQENHKWEFIFLGANIDVAAESEKLNISAKNTFKYTATKDGTTAMFEKAAAVTNEIRNN